MTERQQRRAAREQRGRDRAAARRTPTRSEREAGRSRNGAPLPTTADHTAPGADVTLVGALPR